MQYISIIQYLPFLKSDNLMIDAIIFLATTHTL